MLESPTSSSSMLAPRVKCKHAEQRMAGAGCQRRRRTMLRKLWPAFGVHRSLDLVSWVPP